MGLLGAYSKQRTVERKKFSCGSENASNAIPVCCLLSTVYCLLPTCAFLYNSKSKVLVRNSKAHLHTLTALLVSEQSYATTHYRHSWAH